MLTLEAHDDTVWSLTQKALDASADATPLTIRCRNGGCQLAKAGATAAGPLFTSTWSVPIPGDVVVVVNGITLSPSKAARALDEISPVTHRSGPTVKHEAHGAIALLALPTDVPQEYPDLMVRCKHGDAVLDRLKVLEWVRAGKAPKVVVGMPRRRYEPLMLGRGTTMSRSVEQRHIAGPNYSA